MIINKTKESIEKHACAVQTRNAVGFRVASSQIYKIHGATMPVCGARNNRGKISTFLEVQEVMMVERERERERDREGGVERSCAHRKMPFQERGKDKRL